MVKRAPLTKPGKPDLVILHCRSRVNPRSAERPFRFMLRFSWLPPLTRLPTAMMTMAVEAVRLIVERLRVPMAVMVPVLMTAVPARRPAMMMAAPHINLVGLDGRRGHACGNARIRGGRRSREADRACRDKTKYKRPQHLFSSQALCVIWIQTGSMRISSRNSSEPALRPPFMARSTTWPVWGLSFM
jgi:hypothetical protein